MANKTFQILTACFALVGILALGFAGGYFFNQHNGNSLNSLPAALNADTANGGKFISCATGWMEDDGEVEGLFVLDHMTGTLYCWVMNPRTGQLAARFERNVINDLAADGKAGDSDYVLATGYVDFKLTDNQTRTAKTVVYVAEGNTGRVGAYAVQITGNSGGFSLLGVNQTRNPDRIRQ